jgi:hypothetical protein
MDEDQRRLVYRYLVARVGLRKANLPPLASLDHEMKHGYQLLTGGVSIDPKANPPITADDQDPDFFAAVVKGNNGAIDLNPDHLEQTRRYVLYDQGSLPPPFGREDVPRKKVGGPLDMASQDERLPSALETRTAAQEAHWGTHGPDTWMLTALELQDGGRKRC